MAGGCTFWTGAGSAGAGGVSSSFLISSLVCDGGAGAWVGASGFVTGAGAGWARASSAFLRASARSREDGGFGDKGSVCAWSASGSLRGSASGTAAGFGWLFAVFSAGRTGTTSLGTVISWRCFCNNAALGDGVAVATFGVVVAVFGGACGGAGFSCGTGACSTRAGADGDTSSTSMVETPLGGIF